MASASAPEFYDYEKIGGREFWDGGILSNTPIRELWREYYQNMYQKVVVNRCRRISSGYIIYDLCIAAAVRSCKKRDDIVKRKNVD